MKKVFFFVLCGLIFSACSKKIFYIDVALENGQVTFGNFYSSIYEQFSIAKEQKYNKFYLQELSVFACDKEDRCENIWRVKYTGKLLGIKLTDYVTLPENITYGEKVKGLATDIKPKELPLDINIMVWMEVRIENSSGENSIISGLGTFKILEKNGQLSLEDNEL
ncbi:MAG: hypothetical protein KJ017_05410 [Alphaproteobacteria bacterium]|nr:hypothetical protein [Alphaproteobacteria bacterium]